jgi:putative oxidoreductase
MLSDYLKKNADWAPLVLRLGLGIVFLVHGVGKLFAVGPAAVGVSNFAGFLSGMGIPLAVLVAWIVALLETVGGIAIILGVFVRPAAFLLAINMLVALFLVHWKNGFSASNGGYEFVFVLALGSLALALRGSGKKLALKED